MVSAERVVEEVQRLTQEDAERVATALAIAKSGPLFKDALFGITVGVRLDCGANVEAEMLEVVTRVNQAMPGPLDAEPWSSAWEAAVAAACAHIGGFYAYPELTPPLLVPWGARADDS